MDRALGSDVLGFINQDIIDSPHCPNSQDFIKITLAIALPDSASCQYCAQPQLKDGHLEHKIHCKFNAFPPFRYIYYQACILHRTHLRKLDKIHIFSQKVGTILGTKYQFLGNILCCLDIIHPLHVGNLVHDTQAKQAHTRQSFMVFNRQNELHLGGIKEICLSNFERDPSPRIFPLSLHSALFTQKLFHTKYLFVLFLDSTKDKMVVEFLPLF